jgi:hypothetical protein
VIKFRIREPLLVRAAIAFVLVALVRLAVALDAVPSDWADEAAIERAIDGTALVRHRM